MKKYAFILLLLSALSVPAFGQNSIEGDWEGYIDTMGNQLTIITHFTDNDTAYSGTLDIPQQGVEGLALQNISITKDDSVFFEFFAGTGLAKFEGALKDSSITGSLLQGMQNFSFQLKKSVPEVLSYNTEDLLIQNGNISIGGTLTMPEDDTANACVIMLSGSGAQTRDSNVFGFKVFEQLADYLTKNSIATFRFDDRGTGKSTGNFGQTTLADMSSDVDAIITHLSKKEELNSANIIVLGHSQGGVVAGNAAVNYSNIDGIVLMATTGIPLKEIMRFQVKQAFEGSGVPEEQIEAEVAGREKLMVAIKNDENIVEAKENYSQLFKNIQLSAGVDSSTAETMAQTQVNQLTALFYSPLMQSLLFHDPTQDLQKINVPTLVLFGGKDTQVTIEQNKEPIEKALSKSGSKYVTEVFDSANHLFQEAVTGSASEYGKLERKFIDGFLSTIEDWIKSTY